MRVLEMCEHELSMAFICVEAVLADMISAIPQNKRDPEFQERLKELTDLYVKLGKIVEPGNPT